MNTEIMLIALVGFAFLIIGISFIISIITSSKERRELQKLLKAQDLADFDASEANQEEEVEKEDNLVELEDISSIINK